MTSRSETKWAFVDWAAHCSRSENIAARLGMRLIRHWRPRRGPLSLPLKYAYQITRTLADLARYRPDVVVCMNPSPLTSLPVWLYATATGAPWAIDAHTGAFIGPPWERFAFISRFFSQRASITLVTNEHLQEMLEAGGGRAFIVPDVPTELEPPYETDLPDGFNAVFVGSWAYDEPLDMVVEAAMRLPLMHFHFTGKPKGPGAELVHSRPSNIHLPGFLSREDYLAIVAAADVVIALTTRDHTMQRSAYEAIYLGTPVVVSDWPVLRENFAEGGVLTENTADGLVAALQEARQRGEELRRGALRLREAKLKRWSENAEHLRALLEDEARTR